MQKNDYRRSLIVLRSMRDGYSGHARLERRTLFGDLFVNASARPSEGALRVAFVGQKHGTWYAADGGTLRRDSRGQVGGRIHFDPRNINGHDLDEYSLMSVVLPDTPDAEIAMCGSLSASDVNWAEVRRVVHNLYHRENTAQGSQSDNVSDADVRKASSSDIRDIPDAEQSVATETVSENIPDIPPREISASELHAEIHAPQYAPSVSEEPAAEDIPTESDIAESVQTSADDISAENDIAESVQTSADDISAENDIAESVPVSDMPPKNSQPDVPDNPPDIPDTPDTPDTPDNPPDTPPEDPKPCPEKCLPNIEGCTFVIIPMPACCHASCAMGFRRTDGIVTRIYYAVSGRSEPEPPPGMEKYFWQDGWWLCPVDVP